MNLSFPKRILKSYVRSEHLEGYPNFRYKKLIILLGANASGKTSLGRMLNRVLNFIVFHNPSILMEAVRDTSYEASLTLDFVANSDKPKLYRLDVKITSSDGAPSKLLVSVKKVSIRKNDSYERTKSRLDKVDTCYDDNYVSNLKSIPNVGFLFSHPSEEMVIPVLKDNSEEYHRILETVLKVLDPSIIRVEQVKEAKNSYSIKFLGGSSVLIQEGHVVNTSLLSSGTKAGIAIADVLTSIKEHTNGFYYCDERFSYIQSDVECMILGVMTALLGKNEQLFFTTQNPNILRLPYPKHSYMFLKKTVDEGKIMTSVVSADKYLKRNTDVLSEAVDNDLFCVAPNVEALLNI